MLNSDQYTAKHVLQNTQSDRHKWPSDSIKFVLGRGSARTPPGELTVLPRPLAGLRGPTSKGKDGYERGRGGERREGEGMEMEGKGRKTSTLLVGSFDL